MCLSKNWWYRDIAWLSLSLCQGLSLCCEVWWQSYRHVETQVNVDKLQYCFSLTKPANNRFNPNLCTRGGKTQRPAHPSVGVESAHMGRSWTYTHNCCYSSQEVDCATNRRLCLHHGRFWICNNKLCLPLACSYHFNRAMLHAAAVNSTISSFIQNYHFMNGLCCRHNEAKCQIWVLKMTVNVSIITQLFKLDAKSIANLLFLFQLCHRPPHVFSSLIFGHPTRFLFAHCSHGKNSFIINSKAREGSLFCILHSAPSKVRSWHWCPPIKIER